MKKTISTIGASLLAIAGLALAWWLFSPLFISQTIEEDFPAVEIPSESELAEMSPEEAEEAINEAMEGIDEEFVENLSEEEAQALEEQVAAASTMMPDHEMEEEMPETEAEAEWALVSEGEFQDADNQHRGSGTASIFQQGNQQVLRFENFNVTNGPDLHVLLVENIAGSNHDEIGNFVDLGKLKGNMGNQNYEIATDVDISQYEGVIIYCMPFHVVFSRASFGQ
ncbi:MAG: DM13 domain-containing protein [Chloroflexi bacterium]|nr:DM13 domain-containing protein [Chloroflexota bacterium]